LRVTKWTVADMYSLYQTIISRSRNAESVACYIGSADTVPVLLHMNFKYYPSKGSLRLYDTWSNMVLFELSIRAICNTYILLTLYVYWSSKVQAVEALRIARV
jgi:hypothetical protein